MRRTTLQRVLGLGTLTGMRSMAGLATLAAGRGGTARPVMLALAAGEMIADKTPAIGNRIDAAPLAGRAVLGAIAGAIVAGERRENMVIAAAAGAAAAVAAAYAAFYLRTRMPGPPLLTGLAEDAVVIAAGWAAASEGAQHTVGIR